MLSQQIRNDMKEAMKAKKEPDLTVLRGLLSAFTHELTTSGRTPQDELSDEEVLKVISREVKRRGDAIEQYTKGGRDELAAQEKAEQVVLQKYLPEMMSRDEIEKVVLAKKEALGIDDKAKMGQLIGAVMGELKGKADGGDVKEVVEAQFN